MRKYLGLAVVAGAIVGAAGACGTSNKGDGPSRIGNGSAGKGSVVGSGGEGAGFVFGSGGGNGIDPGKQGTGGAPPDADPSNPNITHATCQLGACLDFPTAPIMGEGVPPNAAELFGDPSKFTAGSLCVLEPQLSAGGKPGAMLPANWVRPRFRVAGVPTGIDLLEIRIHSPVEANDLVAYTKYTPSADGIAPSWYLPKEIWTGVPSADPLLNRPSGSGFANNAAGHAVSVLIRGINSAAPGMPIGIQGDFNIAPVVATGSMVFWTVNSGDVTKESSRLLGFAVGDEGVAESLNLGQVTWAGMIGEDGAVQRGVYDDPLTKPKGFLDGQVRCIGCHATVPDDSGGVLFGDDWPWSLAGATLNTGAMPTGIALGAQAIMKTPWWGQQAMTKAHWVAGDKTIVSSYGTTFTSGAKRTIPWNKLPSYASDGAGAIDDKIKWHTLAWINAEYAADIPVTVPPGEGGDYGKPELEMRNTMVTAAEGTGWGLIPTGDGGISAVSPSLSHDGKSIVYVTTDYSPDGHPDATAKVASIKTVPFSKTGGTSTPLPGASDASTLNYYPSYSQDDQLIAFTQAPKPSTASPDGPYYNRFGKIMVVPAAGAPTPHELAANDPGTCGGDNLATGIINSWPKWSPNAVPVKANGKTYYFLVFSSARKYGDEFSKQFKLPINMLSSFKGLDLSSQLYLAAVVVDDATGTITSYPAVYIWNQNRTPGANGAMGLAYSNLTPAWDPIELPPLVIPDVPSDVIPK
ncbi:MAG TPA: hypothetical protein VJV79_39050 [Polyangiaceae bacterium]|nr:hypothetical protein [Polyangiaceae bacterium]